MVQRGGRPRLQAPAEDRVPSHGGRPPLPTLAVICSQSALSGMRSARPRKEETRSARWKMPLSCGAAARATEARWQKAGRAEGDQVAGATLVPRHPRRWAYCCSALLQPAVRRWLAHRPPARPSAHGRGVAGDQNAPHCHQRSRGFRSACGRLHMGVGPAEEAVQGGCQHALRSQQGLCRSARFMGSSSRPPCARRGCPPAE